MEEPPVFCLYSQKEAHYSNQCSEDAMRTARCGYCLKMSIIEIGASGNKKKHQKQSHKNAIERTTVALKRSQKLEKYRLLGFGSGEKSTVSKNRKRQGWKRRYLATKDR